MPAQRNRPTIQKPKKGLSKRLIRKLAAGNMGQFCNSRDYRGDKLNVGRNDPCPICLAAGKTIKFKRCQEHYHG